MPEPSTKEHRRRRICFLVAMGHEFAAVARTMKTTIRGVKAIVESEEGQKLVAEFQQSQEGELVDATADAVTRLNALAPRAVARLESIMQKAERDEIPASTEMKFLGDLLDRTGHPRQTAQTVRHQHDRPLVDAESAKALADMGRQLITAGILHGMDFRAIGLRLEQEVPEAEVIEEPAEPVEV